ncbi:MAG: carbon-nitrogen hydrolase [Pseudomonadota bacterium]|nr:carbon-nitrogen hydrolase [Pseudomonadota bacterium]
MRKTKIALVQMKMSSDPKKNIRNAINKIKIAAKKGAKIICLPELFLTKYFCQVENHKNFNLAEKIPGPNSHLFSLLAKELKIILIISLFEKKTSGLYHNSSIVINEKGKILGKYRKMHIPDDPQFYEKFYFTPGDLGFKSFKTSRGNLGTLICWDQWFPEAARLTALKGAEIIFYPTAIGWHPKEKIKFGKSQLDSWLSIQRSHAIANGVYVAAINRVGTEKQGNKKIEFWGNSVMFDPSGNIIKKANLKENILICEIDFKKVETSRQHWPFFRDRRIDYYKGLLKNPRDA